MRKYVLIVGSFSAILLIAFLGGMQLGQAQMYETLIFGNQTNEVFVRVGLNEDYLIKRYRDNNQIGIVESKIQLSVQNEWSNLSVRLADSLPTIPGLQTYEWADNELMLFKLENFSWEAIINQVLDLLRRANLINE